MMRNVKWIAIVLLLLQLALPINLQANAETDATLNYTALGDSLAAGMDDQGKIGPGYAEYLAQLLQDEAIQVSFNKGFSYPGYTTADVLADIKGNVTKPLITLAGVEESTLAISEGIAGADVITISAGANDVLKSFKRNADTGEVTIDLPGIMGNIQSVATNYQAIFDEIKKLNPDASVLVMGYYNPFPYLDTTYQSQLNLLVKSLDTAVGDIVRKNGGIFVEVGDEIAKSYETYLPNPANIHLGKAGYELVGNLFAIALGKAMEEFEQPVVKYFTDTAGHGAEADINLIASLGIMKGYEDGSFKPNNPMKRIQLISVLARTFELQGKDLVPFKDTQSYLLETQYEIAGAYAAGIIRGYGEYLKPQEQVTRAQLALMVKRAYEYSVGEKYVPKQAAPFNDIASFNQETQDAIAFLYEMEIAQGVGEGKFAPSNVVTRAQAAKILAGIFEVTGE